MDGKVLHEKRLPNVELVVSGDSVLFRTTPGRIRDTNAVTCRHNGGLPKASFLKIGKLDYEVYCLPLNFRNVNSVYVVAFPSKRLVDLVHRDGNLSLILLICITLTMVISILVFVFLGARWARKEMCLCAKLIKQNQATLQAENKIVKMSDAFTEANHEIRGSLLNIKSSIETYDEVDLTRAKAFTEELLRILNSNLDKSKIEAGKMQFEEKEFNLADIVEYVLDLYHPDGMKKGLDVVFDPYDYSIYKVSNVKGDSVRLKQILFNLLNNAIKFTSEGHVSVRVLVKKPSFENSTLTSKRNNSSRCFSFLNSKNKEESRDLEAGQSSEENSNVMEFVIEVDDTGRGVPKHMWEAVFEDFFQVKGTALVGVGTGLGLGIVRSMVRQMGGEIGIVDKNGKGTCFRFNIFLPKCETVCADNAKEIIGDCVSSGSPAQTWLRSCMPSPKLESSRVVLLIQSEERRKVVKKFMKSQGLKVMVVKQWEHLSPTLMKTYTKTLNNTNTPSGRSSPDMSSYSEGDISLRVQTKDQQCASPEGSDQMLPIDEKNSQRNPRCTLILIDTSAAPFSDLWRIMCEFKERCTSNYKVVWLDAKHKFPQGLNQSDVIVTKPLHGSRLFEVIKLLPEFGGLQRVSTKPSEEVGDQVGKANVVGRPPSALSESPGKYKPGTLSSERLQIACGSIEKPLTDKKILVVEDNPFNRDYASSILTRLGADVELCENGEESLTFVREGLMTRRGSHGTSNDYPFDYIFMDCEMPKMDGYEATRQIRKVEEEYGVHIPIIALTGHDTAGKEATKMGEAGADLILSKGLNKIKVLEAIQHIHSQRTLIALSGADALSSHSRPL